MLSWFFCLLAQSSGSMLITLLVISVPWLDVSPDVENEKSPKWNQTFFILLPLLVATSEKAQKQQKTIQKFTIEALFCCLAMT